MKKDLNIQRVVIAAGALASFALSACATMNNKERGAVIGAGAGAAVGGIIGNNTGSGSTAKGAIIGAVVGGAAGAIIGHQMDQQAKELAISIPGAKVERVGEGIQVTFDSGLLFDFDSDAIRADAGRNLVELAQSLNKYPKSQLLIVGHTDSKGDDSYNQSLSLRRAGSAASYLGSQSVSRSRISTSGRGESEPLASNDTDAGRQLNRRVEVAIYASEGYRSEVKKSLTGGV